MAGYATATASQPANGRGAMSDAEQQPLLPRKPPSSARPGTVVSVRATLNAHVSRSWADLVLLLCYVVTGLLDSASTQVWGAFVSMQTGNTVYVGLGIASLIYPPVSSRLYRSGISLMSFCLGSFLFARFHRLFSPRRRWVLCVSFAVQALLTVAAAVIVTLTKPRPTTPSLVPESGTEAAAAAAAADWTVLVPLALIAFQSCGQAVASRALGYNAFTSVVLTSIYCDLFSDRNLVACRNPERNRRAAAPLLLLLGAVLGGLFAHSPLGIQGALWTAAGLKLAMVVAWVFWAEESVGSESQ